MREYAVLGGTSYRWTTLPPSRRLSAYLHSRVLTRATTNEYNNPAAACGGVVVLIKCFFGYTVWYTRSVNQDPNLTMLTSCPQRVAMHSVDQDGNRGGR